LTLREKGLVHRQFGVAIFQHDVRLELLAKRDGKLAADPAALDGASARRFQRGQNLIVWGLGFVHAGNGFFS
jgi:hypothetical protein